MLAFLNALLTGTKFDSQAVEVWFDRVFLRDYFRNTLKWLYEYVENSREAIVEEMVLRDILSHVGTYTHDRKAGVGGMAHIDTTNYQGWFNIKNSILDNGLFNYVASNLVWRVDNDTVVTVFK